MEYECDPLRIGRFDSAVAEIHPELSVASSSFLSPFYKISSIP